MLVYIFICMLRSLGIQCRLVLNFRVEPLRPPDLISLSAKDKEKNNKMKNKVEKEKGDKKKSVSSTKNVEKEKVNNKVKETAERQISSIKEDKQKEQKKKTVERKTTRSKSTPAEIEKPPDSQRVSKRTKKSNKDENTEETKGKVTARNSDILESKINRGTRSKSTSNVKPKKETKSQHFQDKNKNTKDKKEETTSSRSDTLKAKINRNTRSKSSSDAKPEQKDTNDSTNTLEPKVNRSTRSKGSSDVKPKEKTTADSSNTLSKVGGSTRSKKSNEKSKKETIKVKLSSLTQAKQKKPVNVPQIDGNFDSEDEEEVEENKNIKLKECHVKLTPLNETLLNNVSDDTLCQLDGSSDEKSKISNLKSLKSNTSKSNKLSKEPDSEDDFMPKKKSPQASYSRFFNSPNSKKMNVKNDIVQLLKSEIKEHKQKELSKLAKNRKRRKESDSDSDSDYVPVEVSKKKHDSEDEFIPKVKVKKRVQIKKSSNKRKVISSDDEEEDEEEEEEKEERNKKGKKKNETKKGMDVWIEVFVEVEEKWISVDVPAGKYHCVNELYKKASHPISYIVAWNNNNTIKDVTRRYCQNFNTVTRKLRVDPKWWEETIFPFLGPKNAQDKEEDDEIERYQLEKPLPTSIAEYKNHPLYVLKRHLLKFEGIYPPDAPSLGFVRGEPVYSRSCLYLLRSRDIWLKEARVVKPGENPYKIVKARPKYDKLSNKVITDQLLELFGPWQTTEYEPPTAENGVVPRNAFGNVELFKPCMLPKKTVHLRLPGLNKVARKLNIDCASAIVGFDFHGGWSHPVYDGFVVCEEFEDQLVAAWNFEQEEIEMREREKIDKRVYGNWKRLIKGLLIRERLKAKYDFEDVAKKGKTPKKPRVIQDSDSDS